MIRNLLLAAPLVALVAGFAAAAEIKSGPQVGEKIPGPFSPLNINGPTAGEKQCLVCRNGANPVVMIFARNADCPMTQKLIKEVDAATAKNAGCEMGSFVVFCTDDDTTEKKLKALSDKEQYKKIVLSLDNPAGPKNYKLNKDADVTVVLYNKHEVKASHAFKAGELKDADIEKIVGEVPMITPSK
jgi:hypothetical protein